MQRHSDVYLASSLFLFPDGFIQSERVAPARLLAWQPCGKKLSCSFPGIQFKYGADEFYGNEVSRARAERVGTGGGVR